MEKLESGHPDTQSKEIVAENLDRLRELFPEAFIEGKVDFDVLRELLGDAVETGDEKYGLTWHGKRKARRLALSPSTGTLRPVPEESVDWDNTQNLMIEGDNLEVLKLLQKSYAGKVKLIYIDPPYNTGNDFVYPDDFRDTIRNYQELTGQVDGGGKKVSSNTETSGRFHTDWLNMMYPRIMQARSMLGPDGLMAVHIDEHERARLEQLLDEIFGEENRLGTIIWNKGNPKGDSRGVSYQHESLLLYTRNAEELFRTGDLRRPKKNAERMLSEARNIIDSAPSIAAAREKFKSWVARESTLTGGERMYNRLDDSGRVYRLVSMAWPNKKRAPDEYFRPLVHPRTGQPCPVPERGWRNPPDTMRRLLDQRLIEFGLDETTQPQRIYYLDENMYEGIPSIVKFAGSDDTIFKKWSLRFENPKPVNFASDIITWLTGHASNALVLDFFGGSGTTGHATWLANERDRGDRRFIMVQLPERIGTEGSHTVADVALRRLKLASAELGSGAVSGGGSGTGAGIDLGFRVFKLDSSNIRPWDPQPEDLESTLFDSVDHLKDDRTEDDILFEVLLKLGLDLTVPMKERTVAGKRVHSIGGGVLFVSLATEIRAEEAEALALGIVDWRDELDPVGEVAAVFRDSGFENDVAKSNVAAILEQHGVDTVRSL